MANALLSSVICSSTGQNACVRTRKAPLRHINSDSSSFSPELFPVSAPPIYLYSSSLALVVCTRAHSSTWLAGYTWTRKRREPTLSVLTAWYLYRAVVYSMSWAVEGGKRSYRH